MSSASASGTASAPALWAREAARWPLAFAQVREDPRLDLAVLRRVRTSADVVMIASGGETAVCLAREPVRRLTLVDVNAAQLALCRLKLHLASTVPPAISQVILGHQPADVLERRRELAHLNDIIGSPSDIFGPPEAVAALGPDHAGRYEVLFAHLREELAPCRRALHEAMESPAPCHRMEASLESGLAAALMRVMALPNLVALFGKEATQNPRQPFHKHFMERVRRGMAEHPPTTNPFLWQMLEGIFPPGACYDWLESEAPLLVSAQFIHGRMSDTLAAMPADSADFVHLSNILDWLSETDATECLRRAARVLRPGGMVLLRQLNSTLEIPSLPSGLRWDTAFGAELQAQDRSFFYHAIHVGMRP
jgi:S-adenosylmethionine-diacylglycerol 3-amino-3-carboxypropyl transferase